MQTSTKNRIIQRIAVLLNPPILLVEYKYLNTEERISCQKLFHRKILVKGIRNLNDHILLTNKLIEKYPQYIGRNKISFTQLNRFVQKILNRSDSPFTKRKNDNCFLETKSKKMFSLSPQPILKDYIHKQDKPPKSRDHQHFNLNSIGDLNNVSEETLSNAKREMNRVYEQHKTYKDQKGYEYDKRIEFCDETSDSSWD